MAERALTAHRTAEAQYPCDSGLAPDCRRLAPPGESLWRIQGDERREPSVLVVCGPCETHHQRQPRIHATAQGEG